MPHGITAEMVAEILFRSIEQDEVDAAKRTGIMFSYKLAGRSSDAVALWKHRAFLTEFTDHCGTCIVDKKVLENRFVVFVLYLKGPGERAGNVCGQGLCEAGGH